MKNCLKQILPIMSGIVVTAGLTAYLNAAEYSQNGISIKRVKGMAAVRPSNPRAVNQIRLYFDQADWGSSSCRKDAADLPKSETHIISMMLSSMALQQSVVISVDDTLKPIDNTCQIVGLELVAK